MKCQDPFAGGDNTRHCGLEPQSRINPVREHYQLITIPPAFPIGLILDCFAGLAMTKDKGIFIKNWNKLGKKFLEKIPIAQAIFTSMSLILASVARLCH
jgi:hypothetical protein